MSSDPGLADRVHAPLDGGGPAAVFLSGAAASALAS
jgi:hypothetical protein